MSELKAALKDAKNAIKEKDFASAMIYSKAALKLDRKNYQALAIFGRVCQELNKYEDSKKALLLASQIDQEQPVAWQGLGSLQEKDPKIFTFEEAIRILSHLATVSNEDLKLDNILRRLANIYQENGRILDAAQTLKSLAGRLTQESMVKLAWKSIVELLSGVDSPANEELDLLIEGLGNILNDSVLGQNETNYQMYLRLLHKTQRFSELVPGAISMASIFPTAYPLQWIARVYVEMKTTFMLQPELLAVLEDNIEQYLERLLRLYKESPWGNLAQGLRYKDDGHDSSATKCFRLGTERLATNLVSWNLLLESRIKINDLSGTEVTCRKIIDLIDDNSKQVFIPSFIQDLAVFRKTVIITWAKVLSQMGHENHFRLAISVLDKEPTPDVEIIIVRIKAHIRLKELSLADKELDELKKKGISTDTKILDAIIARERGLINIAASIYEETIQDNPTSAEALYELGRIYYEMKNYQKCLICLLKAAKYDPKLSGAFLYLGHYYRVNNNLDKARKCYEKALGLDPCDEGAGAALSDAYRNSGEHEANLVLLTRITTETGTKGGCWAWLRLGLHYLAVSSYDEAVRSLQCAVQINPNDSVCYECLGDAYLARGSHTAALKVYSRAIILSVDEALYSKGQIAYIKHLIGNYLDSIADYESVLKCNPPKSVRLVALLGLAEVLLTRARKYRQEQLLINLKQDCIYAMKCISKVTMENSNNITVWKLLGDACCLQACLPSSLSKFVVPANLLDATMEDTEQELELNKRELLQLGGRCIGVGLQISDSNPHLWHDLGVNLYLQEWSQFSSTTGAMTPAPQNLSEESLNCLHRSLTSIKKSLSLEPGNANAWNSLGVVAFFTGEFKLCQHSFLRSLELRPTVEAWTHLGTLYLYQKDELLAHEAFSHAQAQDPAYVACWIGQGLVAESVGHEEKANLFRHTTVLGIHTESCIGHAHHVLQRACDPENQIQISDVEAFLPSALDSLVFFTREKELDVIGHNMYGLVLEMKGLRHSAAQSFAIAVKLAEENEFVPTKLKDYIYSNYCRSLTSLGRLQEAAEHYPLIQEPDFQSQCGLSLANLKAGNFEAAYENYTSALCWLAPDDVHKCNVLVALAFLQYKFKKIDDVKTLLFQSSMSAGGSVEGLLALTSLGLLEGDATLTAAALAELESHVDESAYAYPIAFLKAAQATLKGNFYDAKLILCRALHRVPQVASLWRSLSRHLLTAPENSLKTDPQKTAEGAAAAASAARALSQTVRETDNITQDAVMKALASVKAARQSSRDSSQKKTKDKKKIAVNLRRKHRSLVEAQRAVLMCPGEPSTWSVLVAALDKHPKARQFAKVWSKKSSAPLSSWLEGVCG